MEFIYINRKKAKFYVICERLSRASIASQHKKLTRDVQFVRTQFVDGRIDSIDEVALLVVQFCIKFLIFLRIAGHGNWPFSIIIRIVAHVESPHSLSVVSRTVFSLIKYLLKKCK